MRDLGIDGRSPEEKLLEELKIEEENKANGGVVKLELRDGNTAGVQVNYIVDTSKKGLRPKQDLTKPEKSI